MPKQKQTEFETELRKVGSYVNVFEPIFPTSFVVKTFDELIEEDALRY